MNLVESILIFLDPGLAAPYRWVEAWSGNPIAAWWAGTFVLALGAVALGQGTVYLARAVNGAILDRSAREARELADKSVDALRSGDKDAYKAINSLANDAYGKSFFQQIAVSAASLWPAFLGAAWLEARFGDISLPVPWMEQGINYLPPYILCYIGARFIWGRLRRRFAVQSQPDNLRVTTLK